MRLFSITTTTLLLLNTQAVADQFVDAMQNFVETQVVPWATSDVILTSVMAQNNQTSDYALGDILADDRNWRTELASGDMQVIDDMMQSEASNYLRSRVASLGGIVSEVIVMDAVGLNAAVSSPTSDMWQGDEDKFQQTYAVGTDGFHIGEIQFDSSTNTLQCQVSFTLVHPLTDEAIGAVTVGVNAEDFL